MMGFYGIIKMSDNGVEGLYIGDAVFTSIEDLILLKMGTLFCRK